MTDQDHLSQTFAALADPTRRAMLARLSKGEASVSDLAKPFLKEMSLPAVTKHLKVLEKAGLVIKTRDAQWRPCRINAEGLRDVAGWMEQYRQYWEESLDRLGEYLKTVTATSSSSQKAAPKKPENKKGKQTHGRKK
jgi:DNA-binding transcriptional ArsR family regulator